MLKLKDYNLHSFTIGSKHVRAFSVDNCSGIITDYVLGECGAEKSPFPVEFYRRISFGEGAVKLHSADETATLAVTRDNIAVTQKTPSIDDELIGQDTMLEQGKHIIPGILAFINKPKAKLLGMVWQFTEKDKTQKERFKHPIAEQLTDKLLQFSLKGNEHPSEVQVQFSFRKKIAVSHLMKGKDDYLNVIITIGEQSINDFWPRTEEMKPRSQILEESNIGYISVDIQTMYDPRRILTDKDIQTHWKECMGMKTRITEILKGVGFESEEAK